MRAQPSLTRLTDRTPPNPALKSRAKIKPPLRGGRGGITRNLHSTDEQTRLKSRVAHRADVQERREAKRFVAVELAAAAESRRFRERRLETPENALGLCLAERQKALAGRDERWLMASLGLPLPLVVSARATSGRMLLS